MSTKVLVLLSGGMDSTTLLYAMKAKGHEVVALTMDYGQRHIRELESAINIARVTDLQLRILTMPGWGALLTGSSQTDRSIPVPHGHYAAENMKATVVPNRNMVLLALAASVGLANDCEILAYGAHAGDHTIYPDCRPEFVEAMQATLALCDWKKITLRTPFLHMTKAEICRFGYVLKVPFELTWTCYDGGVVHCGICGSCTERKEAFVESEVTDPTVYAC